MSQEPASPPQEPASPGPAEARYLEWIQSLGQLNQRQAALAEVVLSLAVQLDLATTLARANQEPTTAVATWARAILAATTELRRADPTLQANQDPESNPAPASQPARNDIAEARARRLGLNSG